MRNTFNIEYYHGRLQSEKLGILILIILWAILQIIAYFLFEMRSSVDSNLYIENAIKLTQGVFPTGREVYYIAYSALVAIPIALGLNPEYVLLIHLITALAALICIYKLTQHLSKNNITAFLAALLYVLWFKFQQWNLIVYTDSIFANLVLVSTYFLLVANKKSTYIFTFILITFTFLIRPAGIGFLIAVVAYQTYALVQKINIKSQLRPLIWVLSILVGAFFLNYILSHFIDSFISSYSKAEIIYPNISLIVDKPNDFIIPNHNYQPLFKLLLVIIKNPVYLLKITALKGILFIAHVKPYYSVLHNIFIISFLYPIYFFAIRGYNLIKIKGLKLYISTFIGLQVIIVSLTSENWDGRFLLPVLPLIFMLASVGITGNKYHQKTPKSTEKV